MSERLPPFCRLSSSQVTDSRLAYFRGGVGVAALAAGGEMPCFLVMYYRDLYDKASGGRGRGLGLAGSGWDRLGPAGIGWNRVPATCQSV